MGTTTATMDRARMFDCTTFVNREEEIDAVFSRYRRSFCRTALRTLGNIADAEDAVQDALLAAYKHLDQFRGQARMSTWLTTIVVNSARMQLRRRPRRTHFSLDGQSDQESYEWSELLPDQSLSPEEQCRRSELAAQVTELARQLSPTLSRTFQLRHLDGLTIREITQVLGVAEGTVKARLARARTKLRCLMHKRLSMHLRTR
jgi:RNA polymerase sigma-70 factor, ECF subfamily